MSKNYIYDVKSSSLYDSDGFFLKKVSCPKAKYWNQLIADDPIDRSRGCQDCGERVVNLDEAEPRIIWGTTSQPCVYIPANSRKVIFLEDANAIPLAEKPERNNRGAVIIKTARTVQDINRAANMGYWPDVRLVEYRDRESESELIESVMSGDNVIASPIQSKVSVGQHTETGHIKLSGDFRRGFRKSVAPSRAEIPSFLRDASNSQEDDSVGHYEEVVPFTFYYPNYQRTPIAAYLIPPHFPDGGEVVVDDPIEDLVGEVWNQGNVSRAQGVKGYVKARKVHLLYDSIVRSDVVG